MNNLLEVESPVFSLNENVGVISVNGIKEDDSYVTYDGPINTSTVVLGDPLRSSQFYLDNANAALLDLNIFSVDGTTSLWDDFTGDGINVFVVDNAFDYNHEDLAANYDTAQDFDYFQDDDDPFGLSTEGHGTAVSGIIGAVGNNGVGVTGIAFESTLIGFRTDNFISDGWLVDIRQSITDAAANGADIINISQGIANDANSEFGNGYTDTRFDDIDTAIQSAVDIGRGGLGSNIIKSAGNSRGDNYDVNSDPWTNNTQQIVVAAVDQDGFISFYSSYGAANLISAFGTPGDIVTTDRTGIAGFDSGNYVDNFNGTSSAAPEVAGIVALILEANADLGWRDVQSILAYSARHVGSAVDGTTTANSERTPWDWNEATDWNGGGLHYSNDYGYGLVDAHAAVRLAENWLITGTAQTSANEVSTFEDGLDETIMIPDGDADGTSFLIEETTSIIVERVTLELEFATTWLSDVEIYITSPSGVEHVLIQDQAGGADFDGRYTFESQAFRGEDSAGEWTVRIVDDAGFDILTVTDIVLRTFGSTVSEDDNFIFTEEYSDFAGVDGHRTNFDGTGLGVDTINAAPIVSDTIINLETETGTIDGVDVTLQNIEIVITGDGDDTLTGSSTTQGLYAGRGDDTLIGGLGNDTLDGGDGSDTVDGSARTEDWVVNLNSGVANITDVENNSLSSIENFIGGSGDDRIFGSAEDNALTGNAGDDLLAGQNGADMLDGGAGIDTLVGGNGDDTLTGGLGDDDLDGGVGSDTVDGSERTEDWVVNLSSGVALITGVENNSLTSIENFISGSGADRIFGSADDNVLTGNDGDDLLAGLDGVDTLNGGDGIDSLSGGNGNDTLNGGDGDDRLFGNNDNDTIMGGAGDDFTNGGNGDDTIFGGADDDNVLVGGNGNDEIHGDDGDDGLNGSAGDDMLFGGAGEDRLFGGDGEDRLEGGNDDDTLGGLGDNDIITGGAGDDGINGGGGVDELFGSAGEDRLFGGTGDDVLNGGTGNDLLVGQAGVDRFVFSNDWGNDQISQYGVVATGAPRVDEMIDFSSLLDSGGNAVDFADLTFTQIGSSTIITVDGHDGNSVEVLFRSPAEFTVDDFVFG